jgi:VacB/RNase II family 3'-5' exoribonuclease
VDRAAGACACEDVFMMSHRAQLTDIARRAMKERGLEPSFSERAMAEVASVAESPQTADESVRDLRSLLWCSIDNDDSRDLDQISVSETLPDGAVRVLVGIADVDVVVRDGSAVDKHAAQNTTSVYTPAVIFPMLPERLSTDLTSLNADEDRLAIVIELVVRKGAVAQSDVYGARVRNRSKLAYNAVDAWLTGHGPLPPAAAAVAGMDQQLRAQDGVAQDLRRSRVAQGALEFSTIEVRPQFDGDRLAALNAELPNRAKQLIEELMVAANGVVARFLDRKGLPSIRRVVRVPKRWDRIVQLAAQTGDVLPAEPDSLALNAFLVKRRQADPERFPDLSLSVIKLLGSGEYAVDPPGAEAPGHFGLAVRDYAHSTAPNRRYPDLLTQRLIKAALEQKPSPYSIPDLEFLAAHCTEQEDNAEKVERQVRKSAAAMLVQSRIGQQFDAIVTGASPKGTFVRVASPPVEGMLVRGQAGLDVGDKVHVRLAHVNVDRGFIDFER